jgi:acyl carrier protein phosphodiesterase
MNFLAHLWLAGPGEGMRLGAVAGDFVKGALPAGLPPDIAAGAELHRAIDAFAERHPAFRASRRRVSPGRRRFAGVMVDMFYDHFLAAQWGAYYPAEPLPAFARHQYALLHAHLDRLPARAQAVVLRMREHDWLSAYAAPETIELALDRIASRLSRPDAFLGGGEELRQHYADFAADSAHFLRDAQAFATRARADLTL